MNFLTVLMFSLLGIVNSTPLGMEKILAFGRIEGQALPTPVSAATARTFLASCKLIVLHP